MKIIPNNELTKKHIPNPDSDYKGIQEFALTFNGYDLPNCEVIANSRTAKTLSELRASLFFEQRRYRHYCYNPKDESLEHIRTLVEKIRQKVINQEFD